MKTQLITFLLVFVASTFINGKRPLSVVRLITPCAEDPNLLNTLI